MTGATWSAKLPPWVLIRAGEASQLVVASVGTVGVSMGMATMLFGVALVPQAGDPSPSVDSELRFFAAWYAVAGVALLSSVARIETAGGLIKGVALGFLAAGCARILSWAGTGRPHTLFVVLMVLELALPLVIISWQTAVARRST